MQITLGMQAKKKEEIFVLNKKGTATLPIISPSFSSFSNEANPVSSREREREREREVEATMRTAICSLQQALTAEAESTVKQAIHLARRRGHAQVTPLHVATAMLVSPSGFLRRACLYCHSHPLQCKALELCFNVALNRLPSSSPTPLLGPHHSKPSLSNALVAAFKRAQAHQRRGSIENQQQPILALKIEVEQLIISILDDPSVSRVMREAGFSSTQVKSRVEQTVSSEIFSQPPKEIKDPLAFPQTSSPFGRFGASIRNEDVMSVLEELSSRKKKNTVIVGECLSTIEGIVKCLIDKFEKGSVPRDSRYLRFINLPLSSLRNHSKEEVEQKLTELRCIVRSSAERGVILYLGDLKWLSEFWSNYAEQRSHYSPLEQIVMEIKRLGSGNGENGRVLVMGSATFQTYVKCKNGRPSLETIWELHPFHLPLGSRLSLTLNLQPDRKDDFSEKVGRTEPVSPPPSTVSSLPSWLQKCREEGVGNTWWSAQEHESVKDRSEKKMKFSSNSSLECNLNLHLWAANLGQPRKSSKEEHFWASPSSYFDCQNNEKQPRAERDDPKPDLLSNPNSSPNSASSSEVVLDDAEYDDQLRELNSENLRVLCDALEKSVPWQKHIILELATVILRQRENKEESWLLFLGDDSKGKERVGRELAKLVFGSQTSFISMGPRSFPDRGGESKNKRRRDEEMGAGFLQRFNETMNENPNRVLFIEDFDQIDCLSQKGIKKAIQNGSLSLSDSETFPLRNAIVILSCESLTIATSKECQKASQTEEPDGSGGETEDNKSSSVTLDLNISIDGDDEDRKIDDEILQAVDLKIVFCQTQN